MITLLTALLLAAPSPARAQSTATLRGLDVYRSAVLTPEKARALFGPRVNEIVSLLNHHRPASVERSEGVRKALEAEAAKIPGIADAGVAFTEYFTSVDHAMYVTFDIVDEADRARLAFAPVPKKNMPDPAGTLAAWKSYFDLGSALSRRGEMPVDRPACPGFYCLWGAATPELAALQDKLVAGASTKEPEVRAVLTYDADPEKRAAALFVLSYGTRGEKVIEACNAALKDPSPVVRGASLQILADIVSHHKDLPIDADRITPLLDDPSGSVRRKALGLLVPMVAQDKQRGKIMAAAPRLLALLRLSEPGGHDLAYTVLGQLSGKTFDHRDYASWEKWALDNAEGLRK